MMMDSLLGTPPSPGSAGSSETVVATARTVREGMVGFFEVCGSGLGRGKEVIGMVWVSLSRVNGGGLEEGSAGD